MISIWNNLIMKPYPKVAVLIDPEKELMNSNISLYHRLDQSPIDLILIGGSTMKEGSVDTVINQIRSQSHHPIYLFPGNGRQLSGHADGILLPILISGRNPDYLIDKHVKYARKIKSLGIETIPVGYILIGNYNSTTAKTTNTSPLAENDLDQIIATAIAAQLMGMKAVYLEAGSGSHQMISTQMVQSVKSEIDIPIIIGGGINSLSKLEKALPSAADMIVIGNILERKPELLEQFSAVIEENKYAGHHN